MGHFAKALRQARQSYAQQRRCLMDALAPCLGPSVYITGAEQGLHLCLNLPDVLDDKALALRERLAARTPAPPVDALLCTALALAWQEQDAPYEVFTLVNQAVEAAKSNPSTRAQASFIVSRVGS